MSRSRRPDLPETNWVASALCADMPSEIFDAVKVPKPQTVDPSGDHRQQTGLHRTDAGQPRGRYARRGLRLRQVHGLRPPGGPPPLIRPGPDEAHRDQPGGWRHCRPPGGPGPLTGIGKSHRLRVGLPTQPGPSLSARRDCAVRFCCSSGGGRPASTGLLRRRPSLSRYSSKSRLEKAREHSSAVRRPQQ